jgi:hypothetical protein
MRYANNSNYKNDTMIRKEAFVSAAVLLELKRIIEDSEVRRAVHTSRVPLGWSTHAGAHVPAAGVARR